MVPENISVYEPVRFFFSFPLVIESACFSELLISCAVNSVFMVNENVLQLCRFTSFIRGNTTVNTKNALGGNRYSEHTLQ